MIAKRAKHRASSGQKRVTPFDKLVGEFIRENRRAKQMSQTAMGNIIGVTFQQIQKYEKGSNHVSLPRWCAICAALGDSAAQALTDILHRANRAGCLPYKV